MLGGLDEILCLYGVFVISCWIFVLAKFVRVSCRVIKRDKGCYRQLANFAQYYMTAIRIKFLFITPSCNNKSIINPAGRLNV